MTKVLITQSKLDTLAEVIGGKSNTNVPLTVDEMIIAADSITGGGGITPTGNINITSAGVTDVTNYATATVPQGSLSPWTDDWYATESGNRKWKLETGWIRDDGDNGNGWIDEDGTTVRTFSAVASGTTITPSTSSQTIGGTNYMMEGAVTISAMPTGTAGTPTATKGAVSNHSVSVTPSVTNTTGYITGSTKTGTAVTVSASELVSGDKSITANGNNIDVANYSTVSVNVSGGGGSSNIVQGEFTTGSSGGTTGTFTIPYTGSGYPIAMIVVVKGGAYNNTSAGDTDWYNSVSRYDAGAWYMTKSEMNTTPTYAISDSNNYGVTCAIYKNSTSTATTYTRTASVSSVVYNSSTANASTAYNCVRFKGNGTTVSYYVGNRNSSTVGLARNTTFQYIAIYSE